MKGGLEPACFKQAELKNPGCLMEISPGTRFFSQGAKTAQPEGIDRSGAPLHFMEELTDLRQLAFGQERLDAREPGLTFGQE